MYKLEIYIVYNEFNSILNETVLRYNWHLYTFTFATYLEIRQYNWSYILYQNLLHIKTPILFPPCPAVTC
jgi:hypothetical protein